MPERTRREGVVGTLNFVFVWFLQFCHRASISDVNQCETRNRSGFPPEPIIMKTMCPPGYHHNGFVANDALGQMMHVS